MKPTFEGWYYKHQANGRTLAVIPGKSNDSAFIQIITDCESFNIPFDLSEYKKDRVLKIGDCEFSEAGIKLNIRRNDISLFGELEYNKLNPIKSDIMGPFRIFPMECRHGIISMKHDVSGQVILNGEKLIFDKGVGYIETDSGYSFPENYAWVHSNDFDNNCSVMVSIAKIPFAGFCFWGCIGIVWLNGREYRLAPYKGAKILRCERGVIELKQGKYNLVIEVNEQTANSLSAPKSGSMVKMIKESASCPAKFVFTENGGTIFSGESRYASYEYIF